MKLVKALLQEVDSTLDVNNQKLAFTIMDMNNGIVLLPSSSALDVLYTLENPGALLAQTISQLLNVPFVIDHRYEGAGYRMVVDLEDLVDRLKS